MFAALMRPKTILLSTAIFGIATAALMRFADGPGSEPIPRILTLGVLGIVPLSLVVLPSVGKTWDQLLAIACVTLPLCGGAAFISLWLPTGPAGLWTTPWMGFALLCAAMGATRAFSPNGLRRVDRMASAIGLAYLPIGAGWLLMARAGFTPMGLDPVIVVLTAVHFHFAALAGPVMAVRGMQALEGGEQTIAKACAVAIVAAMPIVAAGITASPRIAFLGAILLALGLITLAWLMVFRIQPRFRSRAARVLLGISAISLVLSMPLAVFYQYGQLTETDTIGLAWMIRLHGFANAHGFATCGLLAWVIEDRTQRETVSAKGPSAAE